MNRPEQVYQTDDIAHASGHLVLRLPVRHCELNPIELIQGKSVMFSFISGFFNISIDFLFLQYFSR